jgi:hypothetical protein
MATNARIIYRDKFDGNGYTNENSLANALLTKPDKLNPVITHLAGEESKKFPLTFLTEGQKGGSRTVELNDIQYEWDVIGRKKKGDKIVSITYGAGDKPGVNFTPFYATFDSNWLKDQHLVMSPNGVQARVMGRPTQVGVHWLYKFQLTTTDPAAFVPLSELTTGLVWVMVGGAPVSQSFSMGNESNTMMPGKMRNQISILRKSYRWGGNVKNKFVEVQFNVNGSVTKNWMAFEEWNHMLDWKQDCEEHYWYSQYNRLADGSIPLKDDVTGLPIPMGAGVDAQIPNRDSYSFLTYKKIKETVGDVLYGATDTGEMNVVLYTGISGMEEFSDAMADKASGYTQIIGDKFVKGEGRNLSLTGFFTAFEHVDGHRVTVRHLPLLDFGSRAENAPKHPISGRPLTSYDMYFLDQSTYDGQPNVLMVTERGRSMLRKVVKGMAPMGLDETQGNNEYIATEKDEASVHFLSAKGICIRRNTHCFKLSCSLS